LPGGELSLLLFPAERPQDFDAVVTDSRGRVVEVRVKDKSSHHHWIWGAMKMSGAILGQLHDLWIERGRIDEYLGTLINSYVQAGGQAFGIQAGEEYLDIGTAEGYRVAVERFDPHAAGQLRGHAGEQAR
jgi:NDP-sugar pyrophosphorylase family protein